MPNELWFTSSSGRIELQFRDLDQVNAMYHSGDCEDSVKSELSYFKLQLKKYSIELIKNELIETGGWSEDELIDCTDQEIHVKLLWLAAGDLFDQYA